MAVLRTPISRSQLSELLGVEPGLLLAVERLSTGFCVVTEGDEMQTTGTCPPLHDNTSRKPKGKGKR